MNFYNDYVTAIQMKSKKERVLWQKLKRSFNKWLDSSARSADIPRVKKLCDLVDTYSKSNRKLGYSLFEVTNADDVYKVIKVVNKDVVFRARNSRQIQKIDSALNEYYRFFIKYISSYALDKKSNPNIGDKTDKISCAGQTAFFTALLEQYRKILSANYKKGFRLNDKLSLRRFRIQWQNTFETELQYDDQTICDHIQSITIKYGNMAYLPEDMLGEAAKQRLLKYISDTFESGKNIIYYDSLYRNFADDFAQGRINSVDMLKTYLIYINHSNMYFLKKNYIASGENVEADEAQEIRNFLISSGMPVKTEDIVLALSHISNSKIKNIISGSNSDEFIRNKKGEYFHADIVELTQYEIDLISRWISLSIADKKYMGGKELTDTIESELPSVMERYPYLTGIGLRDVIGYKLKDRFSFKGKIISTFGEKLSMSDVFATFAKNHNHFTLEQLDILKEDLDTSIYFEPVYENSLRISKDEFVSKSQAKFDVIATDNVLEQFCIGDYVSVKDVDLFGGFPNAGFPWNPFLLQSYVAFYSKKFKLIYGGFTAKKAVGAIVKISAEINTIDDVIIRALADSNISLNSDNALQYLYDLGYIARRSYNNIDFVVSKAKLYRASKGD